MRLSDRAPARNDLHRPYLRCTTQCACRKCGAHNIIRIIIRFQLTLNMRHHVHHMAVSLNHHIVGNIHRSGFSDPPYVITTQVYKHHMLSLLFLISQQLPLKLFISFTRLTSRPRAGNRPKLYTRTCETHHYFRRRTDKRLLTSLQEEGVWRRVQKPERPVQLNGRNNLFGGETLA